MAGLKVPFQKQIIEMHQGNGFSIDLEIVDQDDNPMDLTNFVVRYVIKSINQIDKPDTDALYHGMGVITGINQVSLSFDADKTMGFPVSKKPHYLIVQISDPENKRSEEYYYQVFVYQTGMKSLY